MTYTIFKKFAANTGQVRPGSTSMNFNSPMGPKHTTEDKPSATARFLENTPEMERTRRWSAARASGASATSAIADAGNAWQGYMRDYEQRNNGQLPAFVKKNDKGQYFVERPTEQQTTAPQASAGKVPGQAGYKATSNIQLSSTGQPVTVSTPATTSASPHRGYTPNQVDARQLAAQEDFDYDANRHQQQAVAQQRAQGAVFPVDQYRIQIGENPALTWDENAFNGSGDFNSVIQNALPGLKEQIKGTMSHPGDFGDGYLSAVAPIGVASFFGSDPSPEQVASILAYHPDFANQIANSIYNIQDQDVASRLTDEALAAGLAYFPQEQQQIIANAAKTRRDWTPDTQLKVPPVTATTGNATASTPGEKPASKPLIDVQQTGIQAKDIFTKDKVKSYRDFLAMDRDKQTEFGQSPEGSKLLGEAYEFFNNPRLDPDMRGDRLLAAINEGDQSVALLGNDILKLMDSAEDDTELSGMAAEVKKMFDGMSEDKQNEIKAAFQSKMWDAVAENPISNIPVAASMFLRSIGLGGIADFTENPWIFYLGSLALLFGVGSLFIGNSEQQQPNIVINNGGSQVDPRMAQVPY